ncbi:polyamine ABC transporter substrate-binding protein [Ferrovibrio terrae]|uniref:polyamine ABC transporter substrate-binding protein n=1 Tax=Ferrovibrio terrae TaxID=2594003 RepID=UPI003137A680
MKNAKLLKSVLAGTGLLFALTAATQAVAQGKTLYIGMNGGPMEKTFAEFVFPDFEKETGAKVVVVPGTSSDILAKAVAQKDKPQMHVIFLDDGVMYRAINMGLCQPLQKSAAFDELYPVARLKGNMASGVTMGMTGLAYNKKMFDEKGWKAPTSWADLADPKYKGKVVFQSLPSSTFGLHAFLMFNRVQGGTDANVEPGFSAWSKMVGPNVIEYIASSAKISEMVQTNEAGLFPLTPTQVALLKAKGIAIDYAQPKEGSVVLMVAQCVTANNSEPELAQKLAAYLMTAAAQEKFLRGGSYIPSNPKAKADNAANEAEVAQIKTYMNTAVVVDWDAINEKRPEWNTRWNKQIER